ncbi:hypothetical protein ESCOCP365M2_11590 [Escherichia coli]
MGLCSRYKSLTCNSCSMHCQIMPEESPRLQYCANSCFCMWPEESSYFNRGVVEGILTKNHNARLSGYIFVDFSVSFLRLFLEKDGNDSNLLIVFYVQIMPDDLVMQLHRF